MNPRNNMETASEYKNPNQGRIISHIQCERHLPTIHLYSALFTGSLTKFEFVYDEKKATDYLGADGPGRHVYTLRMHAKELAAPPHNVHIFGDPDEVLLFSPHWSGIGGILEGTDCGDQVSEAVHAGWQTAKKKINATYTRTTGLEVFRKDFCKKYQICVQSMEYTIRYRH